MEQNTLKELLAKIKNGTATPAEEAAVKAWLHLLNEHNDTGLSDEDLVEGKQAMWQAIQSATQPKVKLLWPRWAAAAAIILITTAIGYYSLQRHNKPAQVANNDIKPGINGAVLTLANGSRVVLEKTQNGIITAGINKANDSLLTYNDADAVGYNTLETPTGRQYAVVLPDGTKVWLNAASSLKYPTRFEGKERLVELSGEAYFEVVHNSKMPFKVIAANQTVEDLGTHFNVNAYDAGTKTTLLEGSVKINNSQVLVPGQQAVLTAGAIIVSQADTEEAVAWKNGYFRFNNENIKSIMLKLARWYDIEVVYESGVSTEGFYGTISRNKNISEVLTMLQQTQGVNFKIEGRRVTVLE